MTPLAEAAKQHLADLLDATQRNAILDVIHGEAGPAVRVLLKTPS